MRGPIDYIIVGFEGNKFDGSILKTIGDAIDKEIIGLIALALISKDEDGNVLKIDIKSSGDTYAVEFSEKYSSDDSLIDDGDITEMADLLENNTSAGLLVVEHLWAKPLKQALIDANGVLVADGRIRPEVELELSNEETK